MVLAFILGGLVVAGVVAYVGKKYHSLKAFETAVKAEIAKVKSELSSSAADTLLKAEVAAIIARIESL